MKCPLILLVLALLVSGCGGSGGEPPEKDAIWGEFDWDEANWQ
jgi:hypothetical protein